MKHALGGWVRLACEEDLHRQEAVVGVEHLRKYCCTPPVALFTR
jgi:hypothetical protein